MGILGAFRDAVTLVNRTSRALNVRYDGEDIVLRPGENPGFPKVAIPFAKKQNPLMGSKHPVNPTKFISLVGVKDSKDDCSPIPDDVLARADKKLEAVDRSGEFYGQPMRRTSKCSITASTRLKRAWPPGKTAPSSATPTRNLIAFWLSAWSTGTTSRRRTRSSWRSRPRGGCSSCRTTTVSWWCSRRGIAWRSSSPGAGHFSNAIAEMDRLDKNMLRKSAGLDGDDSGEPQPDLRASSPREHDSPARDFPVAEGSRHLGERRRGKGRERDRRGRRESRTTEASDDARQHRSPCARRMAVLPSANRAALGGSAETFCDTNARFTVYPC
jgi:hypothetical protein